VVKSELVSASPWVSHAAAQTKQDNGHSGIVRVFNRTVSVPVIGQTPEPATPGKRYFVLIEAQRDE
jgi:hypothetical protein